MEHIDSRQRNRSSTSMPKEARAFLTTASDDSSRKPKRHCCSPGRIWQNRWATETCSCLFALLSLAGLIATLHAHQNRPLPQWPQLVNINSIVSLFSILIRAGVGVVLAEGISQSKWQWFRKARKLSDMERFDSASRGAWGSVLLIFGLRIKRPYFIAGMGALLTIMASFTGFAAQQLLLFTDCQRTDEAATVGIMKTNLYKASGARLAPGQYDDFLPMTVAMDVGIAQPVEDYTKILSYGCISGNCTFPSSNEAAFSTLAISHWCKDVTSEIQRVRYNGTVYSQPLQNSTVSLDIDDESDPLQFDPYSYTGVLLTGVSYLQYNGTLATIKMLYRPDPTIRTEYKALSCALYPSVNTYAAEVHTSVLKERLIESVPIGLNLLVVNQSMATEPDFKLARSHTIRNGSSVNCIGLKDPASNRLGIALGNVDKAPTDWTAPDLNATDYNRMWYPEDCVWALYHPSAYDIHNHLNLTFQAQQLQANPVSVDAFAGPVALRRMYRNDQYMNLDTVNEFLHNLTRSMTAIIRTNGAENFTHPAEGTMWYTTTCVRVRWKWISYPAIMIGLSAIFLVLVSIESSGVASERLWKSSILAMLFCDMDDVVTNGEKPATKRDMEHVAKSTSFSIGGEEDRLRLVAR